MPVTHRPGLGVLPEAVVIAAVVIADAGYRRLRRAGRAKPSQPPPGPTDGD